MNLKKIHFYSGIILTVFIGIHLINHFASLFGPDTHIALMNKLRPIYRNLLVETLLVLAVLTQIVSGLRLFRSRRRIATTSFERLQVWTGLYLAFFLIIHLSAVFVGRYFLHLDTNFYFGAAGLNAFPVNLFFIPYYGLAVFSFFGHLAAIHHQKMKLALLGLSPAQQVRTIVGLGIVVTLLLFYGLTNHWQGITLPKEYELLIGK